MNIKSILIAGSLAAGLFVAAGAQAAVIPGPTLNTDGTGWSVTGLEFQALTNTSLTSFTFQNQGQADTVELTDVAGNVLNSVTTPSGVPSDVVSVNWALTAGQDYWLLQTTTSNELYTGFGLSLPSNGALSILQSGTFAYNITDAVAGGGWGANAYWAAFNDITTGPFVGDIGPTDGGVPEPASWAMMLVGVGAIGASLRSRRSMVLA